MQQRPNLFVWRLSKLRRYQDLPPQVKNRRVGFSTADLDFENFRASHGFVGILYSSRLISSLQQPIRGQTVERHRIHTGTNLYQCMHVMTSSTSILVHFFAVFIFAEAGLSAKICTQWKFPAIRYIVYINTILQLPVAYETESTTSCQQMENATTCYYRNKDKGENVSNMFTITSSVHHQLFITLKWLATSKHR